MKTKTIKAIVEDINDPLGAGRIKCKFPQLDGQVLQKWIEPSEVPGWLWLPEVKDTVELNVPESKNWTEFSHEMTWKGLARDTQKVFDSELKKNYPKRRGFRTKTGMFMVIDETKGEEEFTLSHKNKILFSITNDGVFFGTQSAAEPMVLGLLWKTLMSDTYSALSSLCSDLASAVIATPVGPATFDPSSVVKFTNHATTFTSQQLSVNTNEQLSDFIFGQKSKPS